jgi:hypothetical protein
VTLRVRRLVTVLGIAAAWLGAAPASAQVLTENFNNPTTLLNRGWFTQNSSPSPDSGGSWGPGGGLFDPPASAPNGSYWATDVTATSDQSATGVTLSDWLGTPVLNINNGDRISFFTRTRNPEEGPSRLEIRLSTNGASTNVGTTPTSVGDFTTVLGTVNPSLAANVYPTSWTQFTFTVSGLAGPATGRIAFRYFITYGGFNAPNGDTIGLDSVSYVPEPTSLTLLAFVAMPAAGAAVRRRLRVAE